MDSAARVPRLQRQERPENRDDQTSSIILHHAQALSWALPFLEFYPRAPGGGARRPELPWEAPTESSRWKLPWTAAAGSWRGWRGKPQWEDKQKEEEEEEEEEEVEEEVEEEEEEDEEEEEGE